jgi:hypothetical protein
MGDAVLLIVESLHSSDDSLLDDGLGENLTAAAPPPPLAETFFALTPPPRVFSFLFGFFSLLGTSFFPIEVSATLQNIISGYNAI